MRNIAIQEYLKSFLQEDDLGRNLIYDLKLPAEKVEAELRVKSDCILAGVPFFHEVFQILDTKIEFEKGHSPMDFEGKLVSTGTSFKFIAPFNTLLYAERVALNLLTRLTSIATTTNEYVNKANNLNIKILDTRKTTPGLRSFEKYASNLGGAYNHRLGTVDSFMIKDNHKKYFGGIKNAHEFVLSLKQNYTNVIYEIHSLKELGEAIQLDLKHLMLDNFTPEMIDKAVSLKSEGMTYELSGGINLENIHTYLKNGIDYISLSKFITFPSPVDLSLKVIGKI
ncbi:carboxylating nicotinate-nucleotide diphosphorylase [Bacteriovoracaceae bacterium]|nr:carboxylating nicotinate-nucleotide diphosphorylase [Bacteriovoracaceae bacterium]